MDALRTAEEIARSGAHLLAWLAAEAESPNPHPVDRALVLELHRRWFETTFPADAGRFRTSMVANRKGTAVPVEAVLPGVVAACGNWNWRREHAQNTRDDDRITFIVAEANTLAIEIYDIHPFLDGNTRTTWHLRNYLLMVDGLRPLTDLQDTARYEHAWWQASPHEHDGLDSSVMQELAAQDS